MDHHAGAVSQRDTDSNGSRKSREKCGLRRSEARGSGGSVTQADRTPGAMMDAVTHVASGRTWLAFGVAVTTAWLPICGLACAFPVDGALPGAHQEVRQTGECAAHAGSGPEHGSDPNEPPNPCKQSHSNGVKVDSFTAKSSHGALPVVLVGHSLAPQLSSEPIVHGPSVVSILRSVSPHAITLRI